MRTSTEYMERKKKYQREVLLIRSKLPRNWVKQITTRRENLSLDEYNKLYNDLVNLMNGRSYRLYLTRKDLFNEVTQLQNNRS